MKKLLRWTIYLLLILVLLAIAAIFAIDPVARSLAEKRLTAETGMQTTIGSFELGLRNRTVRLLDVRLTNPPEFGGGTFVYLPELYLELDPEAARENKIHLYKVRVDLAELNVVEDKEGRKNTDAFQKIPLPGQVSSTNSPSTNQPSARIQFGGIDHLEVTLGKAKFTSERYPKRNYERELGVKSRIFENVKTEKDLETVGVLIVAQIGMSALLERYIGGKEIREDQAPVTNSPALTIEPGP